MKQLDITILNPTGLHARPAKIFVNTAKQFKSDIRVQHREKKANAKSLISMLTLGVETGSEIRILVDGADEDEAIGALETAVLSGLGEGDHIEANEKKKAVSSQQSAVSSQQSAANGQQPAVSEQQVVGNNQVKGIAAAPGIAIGPVYQFKQAELEVTETFAGSSEEQTQLQEAIERARSQLGVLRKQMLARDASSEADIFDVHLEILDDPDLLDAVLEKINNQQNAAQAWQATIDARAKLVAGLDDPLLAARSADLHDVGYRVLRLLVGASEQGHKLPDHPVIVLAHDLSPSDTASLDKDKVLGFCTAVGGPTAHSAIIARALSLPAIVSAGEKALEIEDGTVVIVDGSTGLITIAPDETAVSHAQKAQQKMQAQRTLPIKVLPNLPSRKMGIASKSQPISAASQMPKKRCAPAQKVLVYYAPNSYSWSAPNHQLKKNNSRFTAMWAKRWKGSQSLSVHWTLAATNHCHTSKCHRKRIHSWVNAAFAFASTGQNCCANRYDPSCGPLIMANCASCSPWLQMCLNGVQQKTSLKKFAQNWMHHRSN